MKRLLLSGRAVHLAVALVLCAAVVGLSILFHQGKTGHEASALPHNEVAEWGEALTSAINALENNVSADGRNGSRSTFDQAFWESVGVDSRFRAAFATAPIREALVDTQTNGQKLRSPHPDAAEYVATGAETKLKRTGAKALSDNELAVAFEVVTERSYAGQPQGKQWTEHSYYVGRMDAESHELTSLELLREEEVKERADELVSILGTL